MTVGLEKAYPKGFINTANMASREKQKPIFVLICCGQQRTKVKQHAKAHNFLSRLYKKKLFGGKLGIMATKLQF